MWEVQSDWYSPTGLNSSPNTQYDFPEAYRQILPDQLTLDSDGNPFNMLVFRGSPKSNRKSLRCVDEMRRSDEFDSNIKHTLLRSLPKGELRILDAPNMKWGKNSVLAVALGRDLYLWNSETGNVQKFFHVNENDYPTSVAWSQEAKYLAVGYKRSKLRVAKLEPKQRNLGSFNNTPKYCRIFAKQ